MRAKIVILAIICLSLLVGCGRDAELKNLVRIYNEVLIDAYTRPDPKLMKQFVTPLEYIRIESYIFYLLKNNRILKSELRKLDFEAVKIRGDKATVQTKERWVYTYLDDKTRKPVSDEYDVLLGNVYHIARVDNRWLVESLESYYISGKGEFPQGHITK